MGAAVPGLATSFRASHRLSGVAVSLIASLGAAAAERRRHGRPVISLAAGELTSTRRVMSMRPPRVQWHPGRPSTPRGTARAS